MLPVFEIVAAVAVSFLIALILRYAYKLEQRRKEPCATHYTYFTEQRCSLCGGALLNTGVCSFVECPDPMHDYRKGLVASAKECERCGVTHKIYSPEQSNG